MENQGSASTSTPPASTGADFFDSFFSGALSRAGMTREDLASTSNTSATTTTTTTKTSAPVNLTGLASDGHGLDCGRDPGPSAEELEQPPQVASSDSDSQSTTSKNKIQKDDPELLALTKALSEASTLRSPNASSSPNPITQSSTSFQDRSRTPSSSSLPPSRQSTNNSYFVNQRGGGLGTPTGERTQLGGSLKEISSSLASLTENPDGPSYLNQGAGGNGNGSLNGNLTPVMDKDGLGWPGEFFQKKEGEILKGAEVLQRVEKIVAFLRDRLFIKGLDDARSLTTSHSTTNPIPGSSLFTLELFFFSSLTSSRSFPAKSTLHRLSLTPSQQAENSKRLAGAVKTILECLGEDPERAGLKETPERYAKALLWMTRGYEEKLNGELAKRIERP